MFLQKKMTFKQEKHLANFALFSLIRRKFVNHLTRKTLKNLKSHLTNFPFNTDKHLIFNRLRYV